MLRQACQIAFGQPFELLHHLLSFVHGVETVHPKHNLDLHLQRQHAAKRLVLGIDSFTAVHDDNSVKHGMGSLHAVPLIHGFFGPITHSRQDLGSHPKKCTHGGHPLESPLMVKLPHVISLHQSAPLMESLNHIARSVRAHSSLIRHTVSRWLTLATLVTRSSRLCCTLYPSQSYLICSRSCTTCQWATSVIAPYSADAPMKNYVPGPERCRGIIPSLGNSITRSIAAVWLVSVIAFIFSGVGPFSLYFF